MTSTSRIKRLAPHQQLQRQLKSFFRTDLPQLPAAVKSNIIRIQVAIDSHDPLTWLSQQTADLKTYWSDREGQFAMAGVGAADIVHSQSAPDFAAVFARLQQRLPEHSAARYYGGFSFQPTPPLTEGWQQFGTYRFVVPQFEVYVEAGQTYLACNMLLSTTTPYPQQLALLLKGLEQLSFKRVRRPQSLPTVVNRQDFPSQPGWHQMLHTALQTLSTGELAKIVLARQSDFTLSQTVDPLSVLLAMRCGKARLFRFCFQLTAGQAFIGASPERLYLRRDRTLHTEAVAGTRPRGASRADDQALGQTLLNSEKDNREHQFVVQSLRTALAQLCKLVGLDQEPVLLKLNQVQHLHTACHGILTDGVTDGEILPRLHPTPAVGGFPKRPAREAIDQLEPFERGWYAAPVGWVSCNAAEFAVAIRSGLVVNHQLSLFSGAGIVPGSNPSDEWQEIENKLRAFTTVLNEVEDERALA